MTNNTALWIENSITINAPASSVWEALVNPEQTKKYMFGCETVSDWQEGSKLDWQANFEGKETVFVTGKILKIEKEKLLSYTTFDPFSDILDIPQNHLTVIYELEEINNSTLLKVRQGDYSKVAQGERRYKEAYNNGEGWQPILLKIKDLVENI